jgi:transposase-like protein
MRKSRFTEAQIIGMIKEQQAGLATAEVCRRHGLRQARYAWATAVLRSLLLGSSSFHPAPQRWSAFAAALRGL